MSKEHMKRLLASLEFWLIFVTHLRLLMIYLFIYIVVKSLLSVYSSTNKTGLSNVCQKLEVRCFTSCKYFKVIQKYF